MCDCNKISEPVSSKHEGNPAQLKAMFQASGRSSFLAKVRSASRKAISTLPDSGQSEKLHPTARKYLEGWAELIGRGLTASDWDDAEILHFAQELSWAQLAGEVLVIALRNNNGGGSGGTTCATDCYNEYQKCYDENGCVDHWYGCLCCVPCSLQYGGCLARCVIRGFGFGGEGLEL